MMDILLTLRVASITGFIRRGNIVLLRLLLDLASLQVQKSKKIRGRYNLAITTPPPTALLFCVVGYLFLFILVYFFAADNY
ncbi:MAG: hypothetical protein ACI9D5_000713 [Candidatus Endobugula sp.]|jgi:hypothetical protein